MFNRALRRLKVTHNRPIWTSSRADSTSTHSVRLLAPVTGRAAAVGGLVAGLTVAGGIVVGMTLP